MLGTIVNPAGLTLAKSVPASGAGRFTDPGLGASPTWHGFAIDRVGIAFTADISVVGDQRVRIDADALRIIDDGLAGVLEFEGFVRETMASMAGAGITVEQFHSEYGVNQFEISLSPISDRSSPEATVPAA